MSALKDRLARAWAADLRDRLPESHFVYAMRRDADASPPFSVVTVMRMEQLHPGANAWLADVKVTVVCDIAQGGTAAQEARCDEMYAALEGTVPGRSEDLNVRLCGFSLDEVRPAKAEKVYSDVIFLTAGVEG
jgi:hypothetical protein